MCTIVLMCGVHPAYPLVVAANRDEFYSRPSAAPAILAEAPRVAGGRDLLQQGTWMGVTGDGFFAGITNQRTLRPPDPVRPSRGQLVLDCLRGGSVQSVDALLSGIGPGEYNPFNLVYGDAARLRVAYIREQGFVGWDEVGPGVHVLPNDTLDHPAWFKVGRARGLLDGYEGLPWPALRQRLEEVLTDAVLAPEEEVSAPSPGAILSAEMIHQLTALSIRTPHYGTRSSTILALAPGRIAHYLYADRDGDRAKYQDCTGLLR